MLKMVNWKRSLAHAVLVTLICPGMTGAVPADELSPTDAARLREALSFHASFDHGPDADFGRGDRRLFTASSMKDRQTSTPGLPGSGVVSVVSGEGKFGDALRFHRKSPEIVFFQVEENLQYAATNWNGTVSFWLRLDPEKDLDPDYCDPIQITPRAWNDGALWVDFTKDDRPRHFRLGAFADRKVWDPTLRDFDKTPAAERPLVTVTQTPFSRDRWTHVVFTMQNFNSGKRDGVATLYLDGKAQGSVSAREQTFSWDPKQTVTMLGLNYTGLFDELAFFNRALTAAEVEELFSLPGGMSAIRK